MHGVALTIAPEANLIHLMHGLPPFDVIAAARTLETIVDLPIGFHVCVCDPGVGTERKALIIETRRGDFLIGPDNGVLIPATRVLGGIVRVREITTPDYMRMPVSPIFHGRDVFAPTAAHLAVGVPLEAFGPEVNPADLVTAAYEEAEILSQARITATVLQINHFGSLNLNIRHEVWDKLNLSECAEIRAVIANGAPLPLKVCRTFGDADIGQNLILKDDYGRVEIAQNRGAFVKHHPIAIGEKVTLHY